MSRLRAVLIDHSPNLEKAIRYAYDIGRQILGTEEQVSVYYHVQCSYGHIFLVGVKGLGVKQEKIEV